MGDGDGISDGSGFCYHGYFFGSMYILTVLVWNLRMCLCLGSVMTSCYLNGEFTRMVLVSEPEVNINIRKCAVCFCFLPPALKSYCKYSFFSIFCANV